MKKRIISLLLSVLMLSSLAACGEKPTSTPSESKMPDSTTSQGQKDTIEPIEFTTFIDHSWFWVDKFEDPIANKIKELTGVSLKIERATDGTQLALLIASDNLPDLVYTSAQMPELFDEKLFWPYDELVEKTGVDLNADESEIMNNIKKDGHYYSLLNAYASQHTMDTTEALPSVGTKSIAYRTDIYDTIGKPKLDTLDDLEATLIAAKKQFPDVLPLLIDPGYLWYFGEQLGLQSANNYIDADGNVRYKISDPDRIKYYSLLNRYAREGLITQESLTYTYDKYREIINSGQSFMHLRTIGAATEANTDALNAGTSNKWKLITKELGDNSLIVYDSIGWSGLYISKKCKEPERAIKYMEWLRSDEGRQTTAWGIKGEHWDYNEAGQTIRTKSYNDQIAAGKLKQDDMGIGIWMFGDMGDENAFVDYAAATEDAMDMTDRLKNAKKSYSVRSELFLCRPLEGDAQVIFSKLDEMVGPEEVKIIFAPNEDEMMKAYNNMMALAEKIGIKDVEKWMTDTHKARLATAK